ncbi:MAG: hypothetical protein ACKV19_26835 [Verrucomicrobiales bacterium]
MMTGRNSMLLRPPRRGAAWILLALVAARAFSQSPPSTSSPTSPGIETLNRLVREYQAQRESIERPLLAVYAQRLSALKDTLDKRRDPAAAQVAAELDKVQAVLATGSSATPAVNANSDQAVAPKAPIELLGKKAQTAGGATVIGDAHSPLQFAGKDSSAEWTLPKLPAGRYRMMWRLACEVGAGATVRLTVDGQPPRTLEVQPTTASGDSVLVNLGEFTATAPPAWVRVEVLSLPGAGRQRKEGPSFSLSKVIVIPPGVAMTGP